MGYEETEHEIDLKAMLFDVLYRWRKILIAGLIGALLFGVYKFWDVNVSAVALQKAIDEGTVVEKDYDKGYISARDKIYEKEEERRTESQKATDLQEKINAAKLNIKYNEINIDSKQKYIETLKVQIGNSQDLLNESQRYLDNSVLIQAAEEIHMRRNVYQVTVPGDSPTTFRDPADQIVGLYRSPLSGSKEIKALAAKYGLDNDFIDELYGVGGDTNANTVTVTAYGKDDAMAADILAAVSTLVEAQTADISTSHQFTKTVTESEVYRSSSWISTRTDYKARVNNYQNEINSYTTSIENTNSDIENAEQNIANLKAQISDYEKEKAICDEKSTLLGNEIVKMEKKMPSMIPSLGSKIISSIKWTLLGFVVGCVVLYVVYAVAYVIRPLLRMPGDIRTVYGYPILGVLNKQVREKLCAIDKWIMKAEGRDKRPGDDEIIKTAAVSIANTAEAGSRIALISTLKSEKTMEILSRKIPELVPGMSFVTLNEGVTKAANVDELSRCDAVVLIEERNVTSMGKLDANVSQIRLFNKKVLGAIIL